MNNKSLIGAMFAFLASAMVTTSAFALPALQLGPGSGTDWAYDTGTQTWVYTGAQPITLNAFANATTEDGGNGDYAWETEPNIDQYAYLVVSAMPDLGDIGDILDVSVSGATLVASGYGTPPVEDPNSIAPHSIFDTYFEVYEFQFDGAIGTISDQQPGQSGTGEGYTEAFDITWSDLTGGDVNGVHFDLFTVAGDGKYVPGSTSDKQLVWAVAPYSHDAETGSSTSNGGGEEEVPEPGILALLGFGLLSVLVTRRRFTKQS
jgi:hypothetical protein